MTRAEAAAENFLNGCNCAQSGSILCRELLAGVKTDGSPLPAPRTPEYYAERPCAVYVASAAEILENYIKEHPVG